MKTNLILVVMLSMTALLFSQVERKINSANGVINRNEPKEYILNQTNDDVIVDRNESKEMFISIKSRSNVINRDEPKEPSVQNSGQQRTTVQIMNSNFDGTFPAGLWSVSGTPTWDDETYQHHSGTKAAWCAGSTMNPSGGSYANNMSAYMIYGPFDLSDAVDFHFEWWDMIQTEQNYDQFTVSFGHSNNITTIWHQFVYGSGDNGGVWEHNGIFPHSLLQQVTGESFLGDSSVYIRFGFTSDGSVCSYPGVWVDDIILTKEVNTGPTPDSYEPDNSASDYTSISVTTSTQTQDHSLHNDTDEDWFRFNGVAGRTYTFESTGDIDNRIYLYQDNGTTQIDWDDDDGDVNNFYIQFEPTNTAYYKLKVDGYSGATGSYIFNYSYTGNQGDSYEPDNSASQYTTLSVTTSNQTQDHTLHTSSDQDWYRFNGVAGRTYTFYSTGDTDTRVYLYQDNGTSQIAWDDDDGDGNNFFQAFLPSTTGYYKLKVDGYETGAYTINYSYIVYIDPDTYEPDDSASDYTSLSVTTSNQTQNHNLHSDSDQDWFRFNGIAGRTYTFYSTGNIDNRIYLYDDNGTNQIDWDDDDGDVNNFYLQFIPTSTAYYKLKVIGLSGVTGNYVFNYSYELPPSYTISGYIRHNVNNAAIEGVTVVCSNGGSSTTTNSNGYYSFTNIPAGWSGTVTPSKTNWLFDPSSRTYSNVNSNQTNQNFSGLYQNFWISGYVRDASNNGISGATISLSNMGTTTTQNDGAFHCQLIPYGYAGTLSVSKTGWSFVPLSINIPSVSADLNNQNFVGTHIPVTISGFTRYSNGNGIPNVTISFSNNGGSTMSGNSTGSWSHQVPYGWSGVITPTMIDWTFDPTSITMDNVTSNQSNQIFIGTPPQISISGSVKTSANVAISNVVITFSNSGGTATTDSNGTYTKSVSYGYTGTATPALGGYTFNPVNRSYSNITTNQTGQNYTAIGVPNDDPSAIPLATVVCENYPNPFNPTTTIKYSIKNPSHVIMSVYNSRGAQIKMLVNAQKTPGFYQITWNGEDNSGSEVSSGVYFILLKADSVVSCRKMLMMK